MGPPLLMFSRGHSFQCFSTLYFFYFFHLYQKRVEGAPSAILKQNKNLAVRWKAYKKDRALQHCLPVTEGSWQELDIFSDINTAACADLWRHYQATGQAMMLLVLTPLRANSFWNRLDTSFHVLLGCVCTPDFTLFLIYFFLMLCFSQKQYEECTTPSKMNLRCSTGVSEGYRGYRAFWSNTGKLWRVPKLTQCHPYCVLGVVPLVDFLYRITQVILERISRDDLEKKR